MSKVPLLPPELIQIWEVLDLTPKSIDQIAKSLPETISVQTLSIRLMDMVLRGVAKQASSGCFCRNSF